MTDKKRTKKKFTGKPAETTNENIIQNIEEILNKFQFPTETRKEIFSQISQYLKLENTKTEKDNKND